MAEYLTLTEAAHAIRAGETSSRELVEHAIAAADRLNPVFGTFLARFNEQAREAADAADRDLAAGIDRGPLQGIPMAVKDLISTSEGPTTAQSLVLDPEWAGRVDAPVVTRLRAAGAAIMGKTGTSEFATGVPDPEKPFPISRNPWDTNRFTGGSSTGSSSGLAGGLFLGALGTDTGGSIRLPAGWTGITGLKGTFGRVPKSGCVPLGYTYDNIGPMARSAADCAAILDAIAGYDASDPYSVDRPVDDYLGALTTDLTGVRIGFDLLDQYGQHHPELTPMLLAAIETFEAAGAVVVPVQLPLYQETSDSVLLCYSAESFPLQRSRMRERWADYSAATRVALAAGGIVSTADYIQMQKVRRVAQQQVRALFETVDLVVTPTTSGVAPRLEGLTLSTVQSAIHTPYWNAVGNPSLNVPVGFTSTGLPLGMQISGRPFAEAEVLAAGHAYQARTNWHRRVPPTLGELRV